MTNYDQVVERAKEIVEYVIESSSRSFKDRIEKVFDFWVIAVAEQLEAVYLDNPELREDREFLKYLMGQSFDVPLDISEDGYFDLPGVEDLGWVIDSIRWCPGSFITAVQVYTDTIVEQLNETEY